MFATSCNDDAAFTATDVAARGLVAFQASVHAGRGSEVVSVSAVASYLRRDGSLVRIGAQSQTLGSASQSLPLPIDLASCLADPLRAAQTEARSCSIVVDLLLLIDEKQVDEQRIGPLRVVPGVIARVAEPVSLYEIADVVISLADGRPAGSDGRFEAVAGSVLGLIAEIRDRNGVVVSAREIRWSSDAPDVATIGATSGVVTVIRPGAANITARAGPISRRLELAATRAPSMLSIEAMTRSGSGHVTSDPAGIDCVVSGGVASGACSASFAWGTRVTLRTATTQRNRFAAWGTGCTTSSGDCVLVMDGDHRASVGFDALRRLVIQGTEVEGAGSGRITAAGIDCSVEGASAAGRCEVDIPEGTSVELIAVPQMSAASLDMFGGWGGVCTGITSRACRVVLSGGDRVVTARFLSERTVALTLEGSGGGSVTSTAGVLCSLDNGEVRGSCRETAIEGTTAVFTATPHAQSAFGGWVGACHGAEGETCRVTAPGSRALTAKFVALREVSITSGGAGRGRITGPAPLDCFVDGPAISGVCSISAAEGSSVTLRASPHHGDAVGSSSFGGWSGDCMGAAANDCALTVGPAARRVVARFDKASRIEVEVIGTGGGTVSSTIGIACVRSNGAVSGVCSESATLGSAVILTALAERNSAFLEWSGACAGQIGNVCVTTAQQSRTVAATFVRLRTTLTLLATGPGTGDLSIAPDPPCLKQGAAAVTCIISLDMGSVASVAARPGVRSVFSGFVGPCQPASVASCLVAMGGPVTLTARFDQVQSESVWIDVSISGSGRGVVTGSGIECAGPGDWSGGTCRASVNIGTAVVLTATPRPGTEFVRWEGVCARQEGSRCTIVPTGPVGGPAVAVFRAR
ncbi:MAG: InlB B-repeat-containing protein [Gemmatimonadota bacterium]